MADVQQQLIQDEVSEEDQGQGPLLETLVLLGVADDFVSAVSDSKAEDAAEVAAQLREDLAGLVDPERQASGSAASVDPIAERRRELAQEARSEKARLSVAHSSCDVCCCVCCG